MKKLVIALGFLFLAMSAKAQRVSISPVVSFGLGALNYHDYRGAKVEYNNEYDPDGNGAAGVGVRFSGSVSGRFNLNLEMGAQYYRGRVGLNRMELTVVVGGSQDFELYMERIDYELNQLYFAVLPELDLVSERRLYINFGFGLNFPISDVYVPISPNESGSILIKDDGQITSYNLSDFKAGQSHPIRIMAGIGTQITMGKLRFLGEVGYAYIPAIGDLELEELTRSWHYLPKVSLNIFQVRLGVNFQLG